jgi:glutamate 5-kinase
MRQRLEKRSGMPQSRAMGQRKSLAGAKRIVVKAGSSSLTDEKGSIDLKKITRLVDGISRAVKEGKEVILVSSGAIAAGRGKLGMTERPKTIPEKQALAAIGQVALMQIYSELFSALSLTAAQVLLTRDDTLDRSRCLNSRTTLTTLLSMGAVPIVNENDAVAVDEIKIGENDSLSAMVASLVDAELLVILSDIDGLYTSDPRKDPGARVVRTVEEITAAIEASSGGAGSSLGTGGMATKVQAAKIATSAGIPLVIANAEEKDVIARVLAGEELGTIFLAREGALGFKKRWLSFGARVEGRILVDRGAERSLVSAGGSLLAAGIKAVEGEFSEGDVVSVVSRESGRELGRGMSNYTAEDLRRIMGRRSDEIASILGMKPYDEAIHRDRLALLVQERT